MRWTAGPVASDGRRLASGLVHESSAIACRGWASARPVCGTALVVAPSAGDPYPSGRTIAVSASRHAAAMAPTPPQPRRRDRADTRIGPATFALDRLIGSLPFTLCPFTGTPKAAGLRRERN